MNEGSIEFHYHHSTGLRVATYPGVIDDKCLLQAYQNLINQPDFVGPANDVADLRAIEQYRVTPSGLRSLGMLMGGSGLQPLPANLPALAIVAESNIAYGLGRMFELLNNRFLPKTIHVFRTLEEATNLVATLPRPDSSQ
jgi:hypothetical protein